MRLAAAKNKVVTQMGNQIQSHPAYLQAVQLVHDGAIGKVKEVQSWQAGSMYWILVDDRPPGADPIPKTLHWDNWLGVAPERPYKAKIYHSFNWRAWRDFSNGCLGDFGCHILDPVFLALGLTAPASVRATASGMNKEVWYRKSTVTYEFLGTARTAGKTLKVTWRDGEGHKPPREGLGIPERVQLPQAGSVLIGEHGSLLIPHVAFPRLFSTEGHEAKLIEGPPARNHYIGWADACRGEGKTTSHFGYAGPLTEAVLLGTIAIRVPETTLSWDGAALKLGGSDTAAGLIRKAYRKGWEPTWIS
jgi:predicted dehydrogenase